MEDELRVGSWLTLPATLEYVFYEETELWRHISNNIGQSLLFDALKISSRRVPADPSVN